MYNGDLEWFYRIIAQSSFRASSFATQRSTCTPHSCGHRPMVAEGPEKLPCCDSQPARDRMSADEADPISELLARLEADIRDMPVVEAVALHEAYDAGAVAAAAGRREVKRVADERMATVTVALVDELVEAESAEGVIVTGQPRSGPAAARVDRARFDGESAPHRTYLALL